MLSRNTVQRVGLSHITFIIYEIFYLQQIDNLTEESSTSIRGFIPVPVKIIAAVVFISLVSGLGFTTFRWILVRKVGP